MEFKLWIESKKLKAVIIKGNPKFIDNKKAKNFYEEIKDYLEKKDFEVVMDDGEPFTTPPKADLWVGHSRGADRLKFAPKGTKILAFGSKRNGAINHPEDDVTTPFHKIGKSPPTEHFIFTKKMKNAIDNMFNI